MNRQLINKTKLIHKLKFLQKTGKQNIDNYIKEVEWAPCEPTYGNWISVEEEDPREEDCYIIAWVPSKKEFKSHFYEIGYWTGESWEYEKGFLGNRECEVLAWMPLPDQFKGR